MPDEPDQRPINRRRFFREGLRELLRPLAGAMAPIEAAARQLSALDPEPAASARRVPLDIWLRPPGALKESQFRETCSRCGECVRVCPAKCIEIDPTGKKGNGVPYIDADASACLVCDGLHCMHNCPTVALVPTALADIDMGTAVWHSDTCLRSSGDGCTICVDRCPLGSIAIELRGNAIEVHPLGCIGCGVCQHECPTNPKSITVIPVAMKNR